MSATPVTATVPETQATATAAPTLVRVPTPDDEKEEKVAYVSFNLCAPSMS
jgi:hypothetical protein